MLKKLLKSFIDLVLYGHFWIALAALLMAIQTCLLLGHEWSWSPLYGFITSGTLSIYALHRLVALGVIFVDQKGRFKTLFQYRKHILAYAILAAIAATYYFFQLNLSLQLTLIAPSALAFGYVVPLLNGKRLRDLPFIKIFLIAVSWAWITVIAPAFENATQGIHIGILFIERAAFIFAITIPFDIRDLAMDTKASVPTIPGSFGIAKAKTTAYASLILMMICVAINTYLGIYSQAIIIGFLCSSISSAYLILKSSEEQHDYYYSGLLDGTMILQFLLIYWVI